MKASTRQILQGLKCLGETISEGTLNTTNSAPIQICIIDELTGDVRSIHQHYVYQGNTIVNTYFTELGSTTVIPTPTIILETCNTHVQETCIHVLIDGEWFKKDVWIVRNGFTGEVITIIDQQAIGTTYHQYTWGIPEDCCEELDCEPIIVNNISTCN